MLGTPLPMKKVSLYMVDADAQRAAMALARLAAIHPVDAAADENGLGEYPATSFHQIYHDLDSRFAKVVGYIREPLSPPLESRS